MKANITSYDVIIAGAGLSGLMAGLLLQIQGLNVLILEKRSQAGGICGTHQMDGYEFSIACNDFGKGFNSALEKAGISYPFLKANTTFYFEHEYYSLPANFRTLMKILPHAGDILRTISGMKGSRYTYLGELLKDKIRSSQFRDVLSMLAYALAMPPDDVRLQLVKEGFSKEYNYGYESPVIPQGGPSALIEAMVKRFADAGGVVRYEEEYISMERKDGYKKIDSSKGNYTTKFFISSQPRWDKYPDHLKESLPISMFYMAIKDSFKFPSETTTVAWLPANVSSWKETLDQGRLPDTFGFHITKSDLPIKSNHYTLTINFLSPRGTEQWSGESEKKATSYIFEKAEHLLPGFSSAVLYKKIISPQLFKELYGRSSQNFRFVLKEGVQKPPIYDSEEDVYYIGNSVFPPGEHAGGAILSAVYAADMILKR